MPDVPEAHYVRRRLLEEGLSVSVKKHAVDVGTDLDTLHVALGQLFQASFY